MISAIVFGRALLILALLLVPSIAIAACSGSGPNLTAPTWNDVSACHTAAVNGDTITVTPGSYTVTTTTTLTKYVRLVGTGVTLTDNVANTSNLLAITESTAGSTKVSGLTVTQGTGVHSNPNGVIVISFATSGKPVLITSNTYTVGSSGDFLIVNTNRGVIWSNTATGTPANPNCNSQASFVRHKPSGLTTSWTTVSTFGTADTNGDLNLYIETNTITNVFQAIDADDYARTVIRRNTLTNSGITGHGVDTSAAGVRYMDIDTNTFVWDTTQICAPDLPANVNSFISPHGGTALIHGNVIPDITSQAWGAKPEVEFKLEELRRNAGNYPCWGTTTVPDGYPAPRQPGWGWVTGATQAGTTGVFQDLEPYYVWDNTGAGNYGSPSVPDYSPNDCGVNAPLVADYIQINREYYLATAKPGYTAYTYPHPLTVTTYPITIPGGMTIPGGVTIR